MADKKRVVILGAGFGGLKAAKALRKSRDVEITIVDRTNHHLFQPLLYQVATGGLNPSEIASPFRALFRRHKNVTCLMGSVTRVDYEARTVELDGGETVLPYDYLVMALGGTTSYFGHDEWEEEAPGLKSLDDALTIRQRILWAFERAEKTDDEELRKKLMTVVVVGGGPTGVELAGALAELRRHVLRWDFQRIQPEKARVILIEGGDRLLGVFPEQLSRYAARKLEALGVELLFNERVQDLRCSRVVTDKQTIEAENILWAAGVGGHPLAARLGGERDRAGRLMVEPDMSLPGHPEVYCIGDMAHYEHPHTFGGKPLPGVAPVAMQQGDQTGKNILRRLGGKPTVPFHYFDKGNMATIGRSAAVAVGPVGPKMTGLPAWLAWLFIHLIYLVDFQNRVIVLTRWTWKYFSWKWGARLITRPPDTFEPEYDGEPVPQEAAPAASE